MKFTALCRAAVVLGCLYGSLALADSPYAELENVLLCQTQTDPRQVLGGLEKRGLLTVKSEDNWSFPASERAEGIWKYAVETRWRDGCVAVVFQGDTGELGPILKFWTERHSKSRIERIRNGAFSAKTEAGRESKYQFNPSREVVLSCKKAKP